jgi:hypothetical protein
MEPRYQRSSGVDVKGEDCLINPLCSVCSSLFAQLFGFSKTQFSKDSLCVYFCDFAEKWYSRFRA